MTAARNAIENLLHTYAERIDAGDFAGVGELFADAVILGPDGTPVAEGATAAQRLYEKSTRRYEDGTPRTRHVTSNLILEVDEAAGEATGRCTYIVFQSLPDFPLQPIVTGRYHDRFLRDEDGWRFRERRMFVDMAGDLSRHLQIELPSS
ncbi:MAG: nuclear transport factor 2 family protein [Myxococcales bacterium]|nr:nuclear transport factor 2 family protein [Myxococcales bacterium]